MNRFLVLGLLGMVAGTGYAAALLKELGSWPLTEPVKWS